MAYQALYLEEATGEIRWSAVKNAAFKRASQKTINDYPTRREMRDSLEIIRLSARAEQRRWRDINGLGKLVYDRRGSSVVLGLMVADGFGREA